VVTTSSLRKLQPHSSSRTDQQDVRPQSLVCSHELSSARGIRLRRIRGNQAILQRSRRQIRDKRDMPSPL
jgi:hypothetical protein